MIGAHSLLFETIENRVCRELRSQGTDSSASELLIAGPLVGQFDCVARTLTERATWTARGNHAPLD